jgi:hypothetical protein
VIDYPPALANHRGGDSLTHASDNVMTPEGIIKKEVANTLLSLERIGTIIWHERLNSGSIHAEGIHVNGCRKGTFDFIAIFQNNQKAICVAFIEVKRNDIKAVYSDSQKLFKKQHEGKHDLVYFVLVQSGKEVSRFISSHAYNRLNDVEFNP